MNKVIALFTSIPLFLSSSFGKVVDIANSTFFQSDHPSKTISITSTHPTVNRISIQTEVNKYRGENKLNTFISDSEVCKIANRLTRSRSEDLKIENYYDLCPTCNSLAAIEAPPSMPPSSMISLWNFSPDTRQTLMGDYKYGCAAIDLGRVIYAVANKKSAGTTTKTSTASITQNNTTPSRTGQIVKYHEWCTNKDINVYQNELITKKSSDGNTYGMTQGDWDCYEKYLAKKGTGSGGSTGTSYNDTPQVAVIDSTPIPTYSCSLYYPSSNTTRTYNYLYKNKAECDAEQKKINTDFPVAVASVTSATIDSSVCYAQYNTDMQNARMYGGSAGAAMADMAKTNQSNCLKSGQVTSVGTVQQDTRPRDRNGKLCSEYGPEVLSYSQSMGCP